MKPVFQAPASFPRNTCMLLATHDCNLACSYCYEKHKSRKCMPFDVARRAISAEFDRAKQDGGVGVEIDFMGGEPLLAFDLIRQVVEWIETSPPPVPVICFATTNATLLDAGKRAWFEKHRRLMWLGASVDGTEGMQARNRGVVRGVLDLAWLHATWPTQDFHMTISRETLAHLAEGTKWLQTSGYSLNATLAQGVDWTDEDAGVFELQLRGLAEWYLGEGRGFAPVNLLSRQVSVETDASVLQRRFCGSGHEMRTYDVDGTVYGCHMFSPLVLGAKARPLAAAGEGCGGADPFCAPCILRTMCPTCAGFNMKDRDDPALRDRRWCRMVLANAKVAAEFQIARLAREPSLAGEHDARLAKSALRAHGFLSRIPLSAAGFPLAVSTKKEQP